MWTLIRAPKAALTAAPVVGLALTAAAALLIAVLHLTSPGVHPVRDLLSDYAHAPHGLLFGAAVLLAAAGSVLLLPGGRLHLTWCAGLVLLAVFPRDVPGEPATATGVVHLVAAAVTLPSLPLGVLADGSGPVRRRLAAVCVALAIAVAAGFLAGPPLRDVLGLLERVLVAAELILVATATRRRRFADVRGAAGVPPVARPRCCDGSYIYERSVAL